MSNELQNNDFILPGNLGTITVGDKKRDVKAIFKGKDGSVTITIGETTPEPLMIEGREISGLGIYYPEQKIELPKPSK
jgi:hypothetical protein